MSDIEHLRSLIRAIPDFPQEGILFYDIFPVFQDPKAIEMLVSHIVNHINVTIKEKIDVIVGLDARGFLFGPMVALRLNAAFVPSRKKGKLPGKTICAEFKKEYGVDTFEMQVDAIKPGQNVIIVDDLIATGGTAAAAGQLVEKSGGKLLEYIFLIELADLNGRKNLLAPAYSMITY
ncbi:phosphoribosyltransferase-like protein [Gigaspora rosea]|uniref:adenine phosphoribosyltransferase n=1 Tax=Gigaspora rosea TaxID=44941 RepID=A0A397UKE1_9GLOM|nr:phosphoribosyltransferase-like protein [Gigaspora rosea]CAG8550388.1 11081_t:CDS:2 [Gigaspora rosea]